jgi:hypothetical protein
MARSKTHFVMEKREGTLHFAGTPQRKLFDAWVSGLPDKQIVDMIVQKHRHDKTGPQRGYYFGVLMKVASDSLVDAGHDELFEASVGNLRTGVATTPDTTHLLFKTLYAAHKRIELPSVADMTDDEMSEYIDFVRTWLAKHLGVITPEPETRECRATTRS